MRTTIQADLEARGRAFWKSIDDSYDLSSSERELLLEVCRTLDLVERLEKAVRKGEARAISEIRQQRLALGRLLAQLQIPADALESPRSRQARQAASKRWAGHVVKGGVSS